MTGRRVSLTIVAVALLVALVVVPVAAGRTITTTGANVFVGEEDLSFTAIPANETVVWWVHYLDDSPGGNWYSLPLRATNGVITELNGDIPVGLYYVFTNAVETNLSDRTSARGYINVQTPEVKLDVVLSNSRLDSVNGKSVTHDNTLDFELMNNLNGLPNGVMNIEVTLPSGGVTTQFGGLSLSGIPVDGSTQYRGAINLINVEAGTYTAQAKWPRASDFYGKGFDSNTVTFEVIAPNAIIPATGFLYVSSTPSGASIYVDGIYKGVTPLEYSEISAGSHQVKITRSGYYDHTQTTSVTAGKTATVSATLSPIPQAPVTGTLDVRSTPSGANIYIDGEYKGVTPKVISGLSEGSHQVKITRNGYYDYTRTTSVTAGKTATVSATLSP
ncbi:MAG TPA: PEGA domain-containing protein, partial [Methanoculleus thermophilus]|nr:PEGA domain-containing protein [Methanoculleus thermophilus]